MSTRPEPSNAQLQDDFNGRFNSLDAKLDTVIAKIGTGGTAAAPDPTHHNTGLMDDPGAKPFQAPPPPDPNAPKNSTDAYWLAQPKAVQALRQLEAHTGGPREVLAWQLAMQGYVIDREIMMDGMTPAVAMSGRYATGSLWVLPLGHQPPLIATLNQVQGDQFTYMGIPYKLVNPIPAGAILTTLEFARPFRDGRDANYGINVNWDTPGVPQ